MENLIAKGKGYRALNLIRSGCLEDTYVALLFLIY